MFHCIKKPQHFGSAELRKHSNIITNDKAVQAIHHFGDIVLGKERNDMFSLFIFPGTLSKYSKIKPQNDNFGLPPGIRYSNI